MCLKVSTRAYPRKTTTIEPNKTTLFSPKDPQSPMPESFPCSLCELELHLSEPQQTVRVRGEQVNRLINKLVGLTKRAHLNVIWWLVLPGVKSALPLTGYLERVIEFHLSIPGVSSTTSGLLNFA